MDTSDNKIETLTYNQEVRKAFNEILKYAKSLLLTIEREELRCTLSREVKPATRNMVVYEFINPLFYLKLSCENHERFVIHFGLECGDPGHEFRIQTALFTRAIYRHTAKEHTAIDIEDCVQTDWIITDCSALFEYKEDSPNHQLTLLKKESGTKRRKTLKAVA